MNQSLLVGLIGVGVLLLGLFKVRKLRGSRSWTRTMGTVVESSVREDFHQGSDDSPDSWSYTPVIRYLYQAQALTVLGDRIGFDRKGYQKPQNAKTIAARYPVGAKVEVFFNPAKPADSVLQRVSGSAWILVTVGAATVLLAAVAATV